MNKAILTGRLTSNPELRYTAQGTAVATFTLAINRRFKSKNGESDTDYINCVAWGKPAENLSQYQGKGSQISVVGRIQVRNYVAKDGTKKYVTEVIAEEIQYIGSKKSGDSQNDIGSQMDDFTPIEDDGDLPF